MSSLYSLDAEAVGENYVQQVITWVLLLNHSANNHHIIENSVQMLVTLHCTIMLCFDLLIRLLC